MTVTPKQQAWDQFMHDFWYRKMFCYAAEDGRAIRDGDTTVACMVKAFAESGMAKDVTVLLLDDALSAMDEAMSLYSAYRKYLMDTDREMPK